ncbi:hypothetical protein EMIT0133MI5_150010 [Bacillus velezensis]
MAKNERHLKLKDAKIHTRFIKIGIGGNVLEKENMVTTEYGRYARAAGRVLECERADYGE